MNFGKDILFLLLAGLCIVGLHSCRSKKKIADATAIEHKADADLFVDILNSQLNFRTFSSRLNLNLSSEKKSISSKARLKIVKDRAIQLSIQPLFGVEVMRLYINTDSVLLMDRMNKRYVKESTEQIKKAYPVGFDFKTLQALLTNRMFISQQPDVIYSDYEKFSTRRISRMYYRLNSTDLLSGIEYRFTIDGNDRIALTELEEPRKKYSLGWQYDNFVSELYKPFPCKMTVALESPERAAKIGIEFSGITLDEDFELPMSVPAGYSRVSVPDVVKFLTSSR